MGRLGVRCGEFGRGVVVAVGARVAVGLGGGVGPGVRVRVAGFGVRLPGRLGGRAGGGLRGHLAGRVCAGPVGRVLQAASVGVLARALDDSGVGGLLRPVLARAVRRPGRGRAAGEGGGRGAAPLLARADVVNSPDSSGRSPPATGIDHSPVTSRPGAAPASGALVSWKVHWPVAPGRYENWSPPAVPWCGTALGSGHWTPSAGTAQDPLDDGSASGAASMGGGT